MVGKGFDGSKLTPRDADDSAGVEDEESDAD